jgi:hypothetical protein
MLLYKVIFNGDFYFGTDLFEILYTLNEYYGPFNEDVQLDSEDNCVEYVKLTGVIEDEDWLLKEGVYYDNNLQKWID